MIKVDTGRKRSGLFLYPLEKHIGAFRAELGRTNVLNDLKHIFLGKTFTVRAVAYKCVVSVGNCYYPCPERNVTVRKTFWISLAVNSFVMTQYCWNYGFKGCYRFEYCCFYNRMFFD